MPTVLFDPDLNSLYLLNPDDTMRLLNAVSESDFVEASLIRDGMQPNEQTFADQLLGPDVLLNQTVDSWHDYNYSEQRFDIEWQDTVIWHDRFRTVSSISYRHDQASSQAMFQGSRSEEHTSELQSRPHLVCRLL